MEERFFYAELNEDNLCKAILDTNAAPGEIGSMFVQLESYDTSVLGKKYENGVWVEVPEEEPATEPTEAQPSNTEIKNLLLEVKEQNLILMEAFAESVEAGLTE